MLDVLVKNDKLWHRYAISICKDKNLSGDLVNTMYLKIHDLNLTEVKNQYIYKCLESIYITHLRDSKKTTYLHNYPNLDIEIDNETTDNRKLITNALEELSIFDCEILLHTHESSLRKKEKELKIKYIRLFVRKKQAFENFLQTETVKLIKQNTWKHKK